VQTGVKSAGCEKRMAHLPIIRERRIENNTLLEHSKIKIHQPPWTTVICSI
jgi:hypothetical protein